MIVLHTHWQPPDSPAEDGAVFFWAETSEAPPPSRRKGKPAGQATTRRHPFCSPPLEWGYITGLSERLIEAYTGQTILLLPTMSGGPQPSPGLLHDWKLTEESPTVLAPWRLNGLRLPADVALERLIGLPDSESLAPRVVLSAETVYWRAVAGLVLEILTAQKFMPALVSADTKGQAVYARWRPVLDSPQDAARLARLAAAMPPVCQASAAQPDAAPAPRELLDTFLGAMTDASARRWGRVAWPELRRQLLYSCDHDSPAWKWLAALFDDNARLDASPAQLDALLRSYRAWLRNLHMSGDAHSCVAFRLEAPLQQVDAMTDGGFGSDQALQWQLHYFLQARDDPNLLVPAGIVWDTKGSVLQQLGRRFEQPQERLLAGLGYAARFFPPIAESLKTARPTSTSLDTQAAYTFLREAAPLLAQAGFGLLVPPWWNKPGARLGVRLRLRPAHRGQEDANSQSRLSLEKLACYEWEVSLGDTALTQQEFEALVALKSPLVQIRGQWVQLDTEQIEAAIRFWEEQHQSGEFGWQEVLSWGLNPQEDFNGLPVNEVVIEDWLSDWLNRLTDHDRLVELPQPATLQAQLRPYQRLGYSWLHFLRRWGLGACLADDMGLGKTIQALSLLLREKEENGALPAPTLLVCPTSVVTNWEREVRRFAPALTTLVHQGGNRLRDEEFIQAVRSVDLVLTSYAVVRRDAEVMRKMAWHGIILDEAQNIKNPSAKQSQIVHQLASNFRVALTGTPVENRLTELWSIMNFLNPGYLGSRQTFRENFALPIERYNDERAVQSLKKLVTPFVLRRVKTDPRVIRDLPQKVETKEYCHLTEEQAVLYESVVQNSLREIEQNEGIKRRGLVLSMLMQLKQICNHPVQYLHQIDSAGRELAELAGRSGKLARLTEMLEEIIAVGDRVLIFTQFAEMGHALRGYLPLAVGCPTLFLHGGVPTAQRDQMVKQFQEDGHGSIVFILSLKAGGTGLNLTRANHVFHFDRWWNPAVEDQATDRAFRIGQTRNVQVHKFVTVGTLEEMIDEMIESKKALAQAVIGSGEEWLTELSTDDLRELVRLRR